MIRTTAIWLFYVLTLGIHLPSVVEWFRVLRSFKYPTWLAIVHFPDGRRYRMIVRGPEVDKAKWSICRELPDGCEVFVREP